MFKESYEGPNNYMNKFAKNVKSQFKYTKHQNWTCFLNIWNSKKIKMSGFFNFFFKWHM